VVYQFFKKIENNIEYELEIFPKVLYFDRILKNGEKANQKCIKNNNIDQNYLRKVLKSNTIPFYELMMTKTQKLIKLKEIMVNILQ
jgi:hypothetical protein